MQELKKRRGGPTAASKGDEARSKFITKVKELKLKDPKVESQAEAEALKNNLPDHIIKKLEGFFSRRRLALHGGIGMQLNSSFEN